MYRTPRVNCDSFGTIINNDTFHIVKLENISLEGALLNLNENKKSDLVSTARFICQYRRQVYLPV
jgi:hypothetical protein